MDFRGVDSSRILNLRGGIPRPIGNFPEGLSQIILAEIILVGRLGVRASYRVAIVAATLVDGGRSMCVVLACRTANFLDPVPPELSANQTKHNLTYTTNIINMFIIITIMIIT